MGAFIIILLISRLSFNFFFFCVCLLKIRVCRSFLFLGDSPQRNRGGCGKLVALGVRLMMGRVVDLSIRCCAERGSEMQTL